MKTLILLVLAIFITNLAYGNFAFGYEAGADKSLMQTQDLLRNKDRRNNVIQESKEAQKADQRARSLLKTQENVDKAYGMAAQMMESIMKEAEGDPMKAREILNKGLSNPGALAERMPAEFKEMLKEVGGSVESFSNPQSQQK